MTDATRPADLFTAWCLEKTGGAEILAHEWAHELETILAQAIYEHQQARAAAAKPAKEPTAEPTIIMHEPIYCDPSVPAWLRWLWGCPS